ncbi:MAG TPA: flagellar hook assembly protein FlgD [Phenylobacterium sp.]|uniref:flagellar hook assembly protein FlgD n=1 Tax=Phenylobacterium sp. TaxID=1871053 RepID=UPI002D1D36C9|nr:flagellar hook assembly protein FlgD [Phenylobacterium sp.]HSV03910.1 flagellar hook assembly protein FlgD [Phenylobacterium sp.]
MSVTPTTAQAPTAPVTGATPGSPNTTASSLASLTDNFQTFLSLLTTQLKNQDPLSPLDSNQFTQQLVQMSGVEQQIQSNSLLQQIAGNTGTGISTAVSMIGKDVRAVSDAAALSKGQASWIYNLPSAASGLKLEIVDSAGKVVHAEAPADLKAGDHTLTWNGKDLTGTQLPDGTYTLRVTATDPNGAAIATTSYVEGVVTGVEQTNGQTMLTINGGQVSWNTVTSIQEAPPAASPSLLSTLASPITSAVSTLTSPVTSVVSALTGGGP